MIKSRHNPVIYPIFKRLTLFMLKRSFNSISIEGNFIDSGKAVLIIANHIGWWDGFWIMYLNLKVVKRKFHFMMLEEQLHKHWYFKFAGGYSVKKKTRSIINSINYTVELLKEGGNMVFIFPQGQIHSLYANYVHFEKGIERIVENVSPETQILFMANLIDYFSDAKPNLFMYLKLYSAKQLQKRKIENEYNAFYSEVLNKHKTKVS